MFLLIIVCCVLFVRIVGFVLVVVVGVCFCCYVLCVDVFLLFVECWLVVAGCCLLIV